MIDRHRFVANAVSGIYVISVLVILFMPVDAAAQAAVGALVGNVRDETSASVPGATITATEVRTNISRHTVSNEAGNYTFSNLAPGIYRVDGELAVRTPDGVVHHRVAPYEVGCC